MTTFTLEAITSASTQYIEKEFFIANHTQSIAITVHAPTHYWLQYYVYDNLGQLRMQYLHKNTPQPVILHEDITHSAPYTFGGELPTGQWKIAILVAKAVTKDGGFAAGEAIGTVDILTNVLTTNHHDTICHMIDDFTLQLPTAILADGTKDWLKGDFHTHTIFSDGDLTREENMMMAQRQMLDFFVATDHNIVPTNWPSHVAETIVIPGIEVTAPNGHFNILGVATSPFAKYSIQHLNEEETMVQIINDVAKPALVSINHPFLTVWSWLFKQTKLHQVDSIEIINDPTYADNTAATEQALQAWNILLNDGYRITGIGGSDSHLHPTKKYEGATSPSLIGDPATYVYAEKSAHAILASVKKGHVYVSRVGTLQTDCTVLFGECLATKSGHITVTLEAKQMTIDWVINGKVVQQDTGHKACYHFDFQTDFAWLRIDLRNEDGELVGFTNPYYYGEKTPTLQTWQDVLEQMGVAHD